MNPTSQALIRQIVARVKCAVCGHHYGVSDIHIVGRKDQMWALRVLCRECRAQALILALVGKDNLQPIYTDLTADEWTRFQDQPIVSVDDVIAVHGFLSDYGGDFSDLPEEPLPEE